MRPDEVRKVADYTMANRDLYITNEGWVGTLVNGSFIELPVGDWEGYVPPGFILRGAWIQSAWGGHWRLDNSYIKNCYTNIDAHSRQMTYVDPGGTPIYRAAYITVKTPKHTGGLKRLTFCSLECTSTDMLIQAYRDTWQFVYQVKRFAATVTAPRITVTQLKAVLLALKERLQLLKERIDATATVD